jgi:hypothetical protein
VIIGEGFVALVFLGLWIFCIVDVITTPNGTTRNLPKLAWVFIVILLAEIGSIAWLVLGKQWGARQPQNPVNGRFPEYDRPRQVPANPDDDEAFLAGLRARAEEQRRRAKQAETPKPDPDQPAG